jgi:hypothetical protein
MAILTRQTSTGRFTQQYHRQTLAKFRGARLIEVERTEDLRKALQKKKQVHMRAAEAAIMAGGQVIFDYSQWLVPVEFGPLKASGTIKKKGKGENAEVEISYGGEEAPYAAIVHERTDLAHGEEYNIKWADDIAAGRKTAREPQQRSKFLEAASRVKRKQAATAVRKSIRAHRGTR